jgi:replication factor C subunit 2/4
VTYTPEGLEAIIFTSDGDMRHALNNLQATHAGFGIVSDEHVFKVRQPAVSGSGRRRGLII